MSERTGGRVTGAGGPRDDTNPLVRKGTELDPATVMTAHAPQFWAGNTYRCEACARLVDEQGCEPYQLAETLSIARADLHAVEDLAERRGESHAEARHENRNLLGSLRNLMVALAERDNEIAALRKQAANLATALQKCKSECEDLVDELRVQYEANEVDR